MRVDARAGAVPFELDRSECLAFLGSAPFGRVICHGPQPGAAEVMPVNFVLDGGDVVVRTRELVGVSVLHAQDLPLYPVAGGLKEAVEWWAELGEPRWTSGLPGLEPRAA